MPPIGFNLIVDAESPDSDGWFSSQVHGAFLDSPYESYVRMQYNFHSGRRHGGISDSRLLVVENFNLRRNWY